MDINGRATVIRIIDSRGHIPMRCLKRDVRIVDVLSIKVRHFVLIAEHRFKEGKQFLD